MAERILEQDLIELFIEKINKLEKLKPYEIINQSCKSNNHADIEFKCSDAHWVIEAKSSHSDDRDNGVHKIFGELLKETGRPRDNPKDLIIKYGILINEVAFYQKKFKLIPRDVYCQYGEIIPVTSVFVLENNNIQTYTWSEFYDYEFTDVIS